MFIDTHAHLSFPDFAGDLPATVARAAAAGVTRIVSVATDLADARRVLTVAGQYPDVFATVGLHPNHHSESWRADMEQITALAGHPKVVAIGETGLDYFRLPGASGGRGSTRAETASGSPGLCRAKAALASAESTAQPGSSAQAGGSPSNPSASAIEQLQQEMFQAQLELARLRRLPVIIHCRAADADTLAVVRANVPDWRPWGVMHCFAGDTQLALDCIALGLLISFTGILTFKNADALRAVASAVPLESLLLETDSPFLAPIPQRGQRNEPAFLPHIAAALAQFKGCPVEEVARVTTANARRLFGWSD